MLVQRSSETSINVRAFGAKGDGINDDTAAIQAAISSISQSGGELFLPIGTYKANLSIPSGVIVRGQSTGNIFSAYPHGTTLVANDRATPIVSIKGTPGKSVQGVVIENISIEATGADCGLYVAGASYINFDTVSVINAKKNNILIENLAGVPTFFVFFQNLRTYYAEECNFKTIDNASLSADSFTTAIYCQNMVSTTLPRITAAGRIAYIAAQTIVHGYWEAPGQNFIVIDRTLSNRAVLQCTGLSVDGESNQSVIKLIGAKTDKLPAFITGDIAIDGKITFDAINTKDTGIVNNIFTYPRISEAKVYGSLNFHDRNDISDQSEKLLPRIFVENGMLVFDLNRTNSTGTFFRVTYNKPMLMGNNDVARLWFEEALKQVRVKVDGPPSSATDGTPIVTLTAVPASKTAAGIPGQIAANANYLYICYSANNWIRITKDNTWR